MSVNFFIQQPSEARCIGGGYDMLEVLTNLEDAGKISSYTVRYFAVPLEFLKKNINNLGLNDHMKSQLVREVMEAIIAGKDFIDIKVEE